MDSDHIEGLRKAARRVFWEAKKLDTAQKQACKEALLEKAAHCERMADGDYSGFRKIGRSEEWIAGFVDALRFVAFGIRFDMDDPEADQ